MVTLLTSSKKLAGVPGNVLLKKGMADLPKTSVVVVTQMATVDKGRVLEKIGTLANEVLEQVLKEYRTVISRSIF